jgi:hypothetical protein
MSKEYFLVVSAFHDNGKVIASVHTETHEEKPKNNSSSNDDCDLYYDWYDTYDEALIAKNEALKA